MGAMRQDRRTIAAALAGLPFLGGAALARTPPTRVVIETSAGAITLELYGDKAPITVANFMRYVDEKRFDGSVFYRAVNLPTPRPMGLIQGGAYSDPARLLPPIAHEPGSQTGLRHRDGTISMARREPGSAGGEFFICVGDAPYLDGNPIQPGDNSGFAAFGAVVEGMDTVRAILAMPTSSTAGEAFGMKGQMLEPQVTMTAVRRV
jgi:peptidyl-prolyl cis-trans isomerase A (cyclophilin A)